LNRKYIRYSRKAENIKIKEKLETLPFRGKRERERGPFCKVLLHLFLLIGISKKDVIMRDFFGFFALEEVPDRLSRNVGKELLLFAA
jgi:hypothetical protein